MFSAEPRWCIQLFGNKACSTHSYECENGWHAKSQCWAFPSGIKQSRCHLSAKWIWGFSLLWEYFLRGINNLVFLVCQQNYFASTLSFCCQILQEHAVLYRSFHTHATLLLSCPWEMYLDSMYTASFFRLRKQKRNKALSVRCVQHFHC